MPRDIMKSLPLAICFVVAAITAEAAPNITSTTASTFTAYGTVVTVSGSSFGAAPSTTVFVNDRIANGTKSSYWADCLDLSTSTTYPRHANSTYTLSLNFISGTDNGACRGSSTVSSTWTVSYWAYVHSDWDWGTSTYGGGDKFLSNIKVFRMWNPGSPNENWVCAYAGWNNRIECNMEYITTDGTITPIYSPLRTNMPAGTWRHFEFEFVENSGLTNNDGKFYVKIGTYTNQRTNIVTREDFSQLKRPYIVGFESVWNSAEGIPDTTGDDAPNNFAMTDIYVKNETLQKVIIGNAATYAACTWTEYQEDTVWTDTGVTFTYRVDPNFGSTRYLYVMGPGGIVGGDISNGYDLSAAGGGGGGGGGSSVAPSGGRRGGNMRGGNFR